MTVGSIFHCPSRLPHPHPAFSRSPFSFSRFSLSLLPAGAEGKKPPVHSANQRHAHSSFEPTAHNRKEKRFPDHISVAGLRRIRSRMRRVCNPNAIYFKYLPFDAVPTSYQHTPPCHVHKSESINRGWMGLGVMANIVDVYYDVYTTFSYVRKTHAISLRYLSIDELVGR